MIRKVHTLFLLRRQMVIRKRESKTKTELKSKWIEQRQVRRFIWNFPDYDMTPRTGFVRWVDDNGNLADL